MSTFKLTPHQFLYYTAQPYTWPGGYTVFFYVAEVNPDRPGKYGYRNISTICWRCATHMRKEFYQQMIHHEDGDIDHKDIYAQVAADIDPGFTFCDDCGADLSGYDSEEEDVYGTE